MGRDRTPHSRSVSHRTDRARCRRHGDRSLTHARQALGRTGEQLAAEYLEDRGYAILARRWRAVGREIDLVVEKGGTVAFVEVKTRRAGSLAPPATAVDWKKQRQIAAAANVALTRWGKRAQSYRFDVVTVELTSERHGREPRPEIEHIKDAFRLNR